MDTIDLFKQYVGKLNLRKTQLEAVTRIFKTCMESDDYSADPNASTSDIGDLPSSDKTDLNKMSAGASEGKYDDMSKLTGDWRKVAEYQNFLNDNGFNISVDGKWGPETERAYQAYMAKTKNG